MGKGRALAFSLGSFIVYGLMLKTMKGAAYTFVSVDLPEYDWFILVLLAFGVGLFAFLQETDRKITKSIGGFLKYVMLLLYTYAILTMSTYLHIVSGVQEITVNIDWGLWLYVMLLPTGVQALIHLIKPFAKED